jgi:hypothetical protein
MLYLEISNIRGKIMPGQVLVRRHMAGGVKRMIRGQELSRAGDVVKIKVEGQFYPITAKAEDVIPGTQVFGSTKPGQRPDIVIKQHPMSPNALGNKLHRF